MPRFVRPLALVFVLLLAAVALLNGAGSVGLFETSEARYAEVAREMVQTGDFLSPQINFVYHFTKPPLTYWWTALGYALFGETPFGARFFVALFALGTLAFTARSYQVGTGRSGALAAAILASSGLFFAFAKILTTDLFLTFLTTAGFLLFARLEAGEIPPLRGRALLGFVAGLAFLTKGPVALLVWGCVLLPYAFWKDKGRCLKPLAHPLCWGLFLAVAVPWFVLVGLKHPGLFQYLLLKESSEAVYSSKRFHPGPFYYYLPVLLGGVLPWWLFLAARWREVLRPENRLWLLWATLPVVVWSCFAAKMPSYILPAIPAWALLTAKVVEGERPPGRWLFVVAGGMVGAVPGLALVAVLLGKVKAVSALSPTSYALLALAAALGLVAAGLGMAHMRRWALAGLLGAALTFQFAVPHLCLDLGPKLSPRPGLGQFLAERRLPGEAVLEYRVTLFSVPFYIRDKAFAYKSNFIRKKFVAGVPGHIMQEPEELVQFLAVTPNLWVVADDKGEGLLAQEIPGLELVFREGDNTVWASPALARRLGR